MGGVPGVVARPQDDAVNRVGREVEEFTRSVGIVFAAGNTFKGVSCR